MARASTSRLAVNPVLGLRPSLENCRVPDLRIDGSYQRSIDNGSSKDLIRRIAQHWNWSLFHPLSVARRADGSLWVVDGQHRLAAARLRRDIYDLPCVVTRYDSAEDEAASFVAMNVQRRAMTAIDLFRAALASGDDTARKVARLLDRVGLTLAPHTNFTAWKPGMVSNIGGIQKVFRKSGEALTHRALVLTAQAFEGEVLRYAGTLFSSIAQLLHDAKGQIDDELLLMVLQGDKQKGWVAAIEIERAQQAVARHVAGGCVLLTAYQEALGCDDDE